MSQTESSVAGTTVEVVRTIPAPPEMVYAAWTQPPFIRQWFTAGHVMPHCDFVAEVGRPYSLGYHYQGRTGKVTGVIQEVIPNQRLSYTWTVLGEPGEAVDSLVTVTFRPVEGGTQVRVRHERLTSERARSDTLGGWTQIVELMDRMAEIAGLEARVRESKKKLAAMRKDLPPMRVDDAEVTAQDGRRVRLSDLFGGRDELLLIHNMGKRCVYCTLWADGFNGVWRHLADRAALAVLSPDEPAVQKEFAGSRGWTFPMFSTHWSELGKQLGYEGHVGGKGQAFPGVSTLRRDKDGSMWRVAHTHFGPGDDFCAVWHLFDLLPNGQDGWAPKYAYA